jgi:hypothetical protein
MKINSRAERVTITVSREELDHWRSYNNRESLSAFIRDAMDFYVNEIEKDKQESEEFSKLIEKNSSQIQRIKENLIGVQAVLTEHKIIPSIEKNSTQIQRIEEDLIEIQAALAEHEIIPDIEPDARIIQFIEQKIAGTAVIIEDRRILARIKQHFK